MLRIVCGFSKAVAVFTAAGLGFVAVSCSRPDADKDQDGAGEQRQAAIAVHESPAEQFVGYQRCAACHPDKVEQFATTGHATTFRVPEQSDDFDFLCGTQFVDPDRGSVMRYSCSDEGLAVGIPVVFPDRNFPLQFALGSGEHAVTFLTLVPDQHGETVGVEHRVSLFGGERLDRTPGATALPPGQPVEHFGKLIEGEQLQECINCHTTSARIAGTEVHDLLPHVQCESCHGPASRHVAAMESGAADTLIRFAPGTASAREELLMCGRCHRVPEMLSDTALDRSSAALARYQPVGILQSPCHLQSPQGLSCTTCHDPHRRADSMSRIEYSNTCKNCHASQHVGDCPKAARRQDCVGCHMPRVEVHPGIAFHDHWIRVRDARDPPTAEPAAESAAK